jgi:hypothetical protein
MRFSRRVLPRRTPAVVKSLPLSLPLYFTTAGVEEGSCASLDAYADVC